MQSVYVVVVYNKERRIQQLPKLLLIDKENRLYRIPLYDNESGKSIKQIKDEVMKARSLLLKLNDKEVPVVTNCFRQIFYALEFPVDMRDYDVYDMHEHDYLYTEEEAVLKIQSYKTKKKKKYQKLLANSSVVYADLEKRGLLYNYTKVNPIWTQDTYSGRSKSTGFNIQGFHEPARISNISALDSDILIHFDWICADIRVASILSGDKSLQTAFVRSDPYKFLMKTLNKVRSEQGLQDSFDREECKLVLLKSINSLDYRSIVFTEAYPALGEWIKDVASNDSGFSMMGREFCVTEQKGKLSVFNGIMQGSVSHAMQSVMRKIWSKCANRIICDIHDSVVLNVSPDHTDIKSIVRIVGDAMIEPFGDGNLFPFKVSIGKKWREYSHYVTVYNRDKLDVL